MDSDKPVKKKVQGKSKGNTFERKIANMLSARFKAHLNIESGFRRNADSGAYFGGSNIYRTEKYDTELATFGDLICPRTFKFSIECKHYKTPPSLQSIINNNVKMWDKWIIQAEQDSTKASKLFLLIVKYNNTDELVFIDNQEVDIPLIFIYKNKFVYRLEEFLKLPESKFFNLNSESDSI
jgi:hypothetical protein